MEVAEDEGDVRQKTHLMKGKCLMKQKIPTRASFTGSLLLFSAMAIMTIVGFGGCQSNQTTATNVPELADEPTLVRQRIASEDELARLETASEVLLPSNLERDNAEPTTALDFSGESEQVYTCYVTPIQANADGITVRLATRGEFGFRALLVSFKNGDGAGADFSPESVELTTMDGVVLTRLYRDEALDPWEAEAGVQAGKVTGWLDCFLRCIDRTVARYWWLDAICGAGTPIQTYYCLLASGAVSWGIISWCIGSASGYCP